MFSPSSDTITALFLPQQNWHLFSITFYAWQLVMSKTFITSLTVLGILGRLLFICLFHFCFLVSLLRHLTYASPTDRIQKVFSSSERAIGTSACKPSKFGHSQV